MWAILALAIGVTVFVADALDGGDADDQVVGSSDVTLPEGAGSAPSSTDAATVVPGRGQTLVGGTVTAVHLEGALPEPRQVPTPLTIVSDRGFGNGAEVTDVLIGGEASSIVWDGGRPFVLSSGGALVVDPLTVDLIPEGFRLALGGSAHRFTPGSYQLDTPVAVGRAGIATPRDAVNFDAIEASLLAARGDAAVTLSGATARRFSGPGLLHLEGTLELRDASGTRAAPAFDVGQAAFELTFTPDGAGGWTVAGLVDESSGGG
jgi:hypothetical protein